MRQEYDFSEAERGRFFRAKARVNLPVSEEKPDWALPDGRLGCFIVEEAERTLNAYREQPSLVTEAANQEHDTTHGGYAHRQLFELVQNSADALASFSHHGSILLRLTDSHLYCADDGRPIDEDGMRALMFSHMSPKRDTGEIGRFGLGFKSVLGVTDAPELFCRSGSFRFDRKCAATRIRKVCPNAERFPVLRLPKPIDPRESMEHDEDLRELASWANSIVRLPLKPGARDDLARQILDFPPEFLLFVEHVRYLTLQDEGSERSRDFLLENRGGELRLDTGEQITRWVRCKRTHHLSPEAEADRRGLDDSGEAPIWWAAPIDRLNEPGRFWAFFPTNTMSLVAGIVNAPWKTNEDRQNLLSGPYNDELIDAAAEMIADTLPQLAPSDDPARHLDALPRRREQGDPEHANQLRERLFFHLHNRKIVPDQDGIQRTCRDISYPPKELTQDGRRGRAAFERWAAYPGRPREWVHHTALTRNRIAVMERLFQVSAPSSPDMLQGIPTNAMPRATIAKWLETLAKSGKSDDAVQASMAAIQVAELIPSGVRTGACLGEVVLTAGGDLRTPDPDRLFLPEETGNGGSVTDPASYVHPELTADRDTLRALKALGLKPPSPDAGFKLVANRILGGTSGQATDGDIYGELWIASRKLEAEAAHAVIGEWRTRLRARTRAGDWQPLHSVLLPGDIVPGDGSRDAAATVDLQFHEPDQKLLHLLGVTAQPQDDRDLSVEPGFDSYLRSCRDQFRGRPDLPHTPIPRCLDFKSKRSAGPLEVLAVLSDEGRALYTDALLHLGTTYVPWTMQHTGANGRIYPPMQCESLAIDILRKHGRVRTPCGIVSLADALGPQPASQTALHALLVHPNADRSKAAFKLAGPMPEFFGEQDPNPLTDEWPGLKQHLPLHLKSCRLVRCERILVLDEVRECVFHAPDVYLANPADTDEPYDPSDPDFSGLDFGGNPRGLRLVADKLELGLSDQQIEAILQRKTLPEVEARRAAIRRCSTDAERLLAAVPAPLLRRGLPDSLLDVLDDDGDRLPGIELAEAAIATWHTDALKQYKQALDLLDPPSKWAGSARAVQFVQSLGFSAEWAGERARERDPFLEVEGPYSLPKLHDYQETIAGNVRNLLRGERGNGAERRGMISLPTGSGKTRVAVQAIVEAMREDGFRGDILWVADRDELCEQAVEAWRQVWASVGVRTSRLRISRMWARQPRPLPTNEFHVVVATIQTLNAKLSNQRGDYEFLANCRLVVFDEAHRSIAPTFTSVMQDIGLTRFRRADEPFLLGLTATPYRGRDEVETERLVRRYGGKRLDAGAFTSDDPQAVIRELQGMGVLAQADHETIEGERFSAETFSPEVWKRILEELERASSQPWLPQSVENRIARSATRTRRIIEAYGRHVRPDWPALIFATSVEHAQTVAALLNRRGIRARAVSGDTEPATRRRVVEEFRCGKIRALVNYGVFREGFDAPKTRAIIVARPVYSPNLYFQMIGRGLRGPMNGGEERCLILDVRDNIQSFDRALAFSELDWLWA